MIQHSPLVRWIFRSHKNYVYICYVFTVAVMGVLIPNYKKYNSLWCNHLHICCKVLKGEHCQHAWMFGYIDALFLLLLYQLCSLMSAFKVTHISLAGYVFCMNCYSIVKISSKSMKLSGFFCPTIAVEENNVRT